MPNDAPTVVRPDLAALNDPELKAMLEEASAPAPSEAETAYVPNPLASHPPPQNAPPAGHPAASPFPEKFEGPAAEEPTIALPNPLADLEGVPGYSPPPEPPKEPTPAPQSSRRVAPAPRSADRPKKRKLPKGAQVAKKGESFRDEDEGLNPLHIVYGTVAVMGMLLVVGATVAAFVILLYMN